MAIIKPNLSNLKNFKLKIKKSTICCTSFFPGILSGEIRNTKLPVLICQANYTPQNASPIFYLVVFSIGYIVLYSNFSVGAIFRSNFQKNQSAFKIISQNSLRTLFRQGQILSDFLKTDILFCIFLLKTEPTEKLVCTTIQNG